MTLGLLVWSVLCLGLAFFAGSGAETTTSGPPIVFGLGLGCVVWALGVGAWMLARAVL